MRPPVPVPTERVASYTAEGHWNDRLLRDGIERAASELPHQVAVADNHRQVTWPEFSELVSAGVARLGEIGLNAGDPVILVAGNTIEGVVAYHSLLRIGALILALDRRCGPADVEAAREAMGLATVILPDRVRASLLASAGPGTVLRLETFLEKRSDPDRVESWSEPDRDAVALVLFTSGTTRRPKGVAHSLNTLTCGARNMALTCGVESDAVLFLVSPMTSITGVVQMHLAVNQHAALVLEDDFHPQDSLDRLNRWGATVIGGAPVILERLIKAADSRPGVGLSLKIVALGGAMLPRPLLDRITFEFGVAVARVYGSSEAPNATGSIPSDSIEVKLADDGELMPGGEIKVGSSGHPQEGMLQGPNLFLGYLDADDNREAFEDGWYRTGDLVEVSEGRVTVVGRLKEVVNRNGLKISLSEIDAALEGLPGAEEWAAFGLADPDTGERLVVAVLPKTGSSVDLAAVQSYLQLGGVAIRKLPEQVAVWDEALPRTASGKIIRARLAGEVSTKQSFLAERLTAMTNQS